MKNLKKIILCLFLSGSIGCVFDNPFICENIVYLHIGKTEGHDMAKCYHGKGFKRARRFPLTQNITELKAQGYSFIDVVRKINFERAEEQRIRDLLTAFSVK